MHYLCFGGIIRNKNAVAIAANADYTTSAKRKMYFKEK